MIKYCFSKFSTHMILILLSSKFSSHMILTSHATVSCLCISPSVGCYNQIMWFRYRADACAALTWEKNRPRFNRHRSSSCVDTSWTYRFLRFSQKNECDRFFSSLEGLCISLKKHLYVFFNALFSLIIVVGTVEGGRPPTKIKTDLKKPIVNLACHPRLPVFVSQSFLHFFFLVIPLHIFLVSFLFSYLDIQTFNFSM